MKILLISDSHGDLQSLKTIANMHPNMDRYIHAGDSERTIEEIAPFMSVKGNCDYMSNFPNQIILDTPMGKMMIRHSPYLKDYEIDNLKIKIYVYGHTHYKHFEKINDVYYINPGSISRPRDDTKGSYAILEISNSDIKVEFKDL